MKIPLIRMFGLLISMTILAVGSCTEFEQVDLINGGNATIQFPTSGFTHFYEINCTTGSEISRIGRYCSTNGSCTTRSSAPNVLIESGSLILLNVTSNKCYSAKTIPGNTKYYVTTDSEKPLRSTISPEISNSTATPFCTSPSDTSGVSTADLVDVVGGGVIVAVVVILLFVAYLKYKEPPRKYGSVMIV